MAHYAETPFTVLISCLLSLRTQDATTIVAKGVKPGEIVVTDGQMILIAGSLVRISSSSPARPGS